MHNNNQQQFTNICDIINRGIHKPYNYLEDAKQTLKGTTFGGAVGFLGGFVKFGTDKVRTNINKPIYIAETYQPNKKKLNDQINDTTNEINECNNQIKEKEKEQTSTKQTFDNVNTQCLTKFQNFVEYNEEIDKQIKAHLSEEDKKNFAKYHHCTNKQFKPFFRISTESQNELEISTEKIKRCPKIEVQQIECTKKYNGHEYVTDIGSFPISKDYKAYKGQYKELNDQIDDYYNTYNEYHSLSKKYIQINKNIKSLQNNLNKLTTTKNNLENKLIEEEQKLNDYKIDSGLKLPSTCAIIGATTGGFRAHKNYKRSLTVPIDGTTKSALYVFPLDSKEIGRDTNFHDLQQQNRSFIWVDELDESITIVGNNQNAQNLKQVLNLPQDDNNATIYNDNPNFGLLCSALLQYTPRQRGSLVEFLQAHQDNNIQHNNAQFNLQQTNGHRNALCNIY